MREAGGVLTKEQIAGISAVAILRELMSRSADDATILGWTLQENHYLKDLPKRNAPPIDYEALQKRMLEDGAALDFLGDPNSTLGLSRNASSLLRELASRQLAIDAVDYSGILKGRFPFDTSRRGSLFRYYIIGYDGDPSDAARHLIFTAPFFLQIRSLLECLESPEAGMAVVKFEGDSTRNLEVDLFLRLTASINNIHRLRGDCGDNKQTLQALEVPRTPELRVIKSLSDEEKVVLAHEYLNFLLSGEAGTQLKRKTILGHLLVGYNQKSVWQQLHENRQFMEHVQEFRANYGAIPEGTRPVLVYNPNLATKDDLFLQACYALEVDRSKYTPSSPIGHCGILFGPRCLAAITQTPESVEALGRVRVYTFESGIPSAANSILRPVLPVSNIEEHKQFFDHLLKIIPIPGVADPNATEQFCRVCAQKRGKSFTVNDAVEIALEEATYVSEAQLRALVLLLRQHNQFELGDSAKRLLVEKFRIAPHLIEEIEAFGRFRPKQVGILPSGLVDLTSFDKTRSIGLHGIGLKRESCLLAEILGRSNIAIVVDTTQYDADDSSDSGNFVAYTRPGERVLNSFITDLLTGAITFNNRSPSVIGVAPSTEGNAILQMLGVAPAQQGPRLQKINTLLSRIHTFDDQAIIVIDAEAIDDLTDVQRLIELLKDYPLKIVVRSSESIPGIDQVLVVPWSDIEVQRRLADENGRLVKELGLTGDISAEVLEFTCKQVQELRTPSEDPMHLAVSVLQIAATSAVAEGQSELVKNDIIAALRRVFISRIQSERSKLYAELMKYKSNYQKS